MLPTKYGMDELVAAYIGLIDIYGDMLLPDERKDPGYQQLSQMAARLLYNTLADMPVQEKMNFCLQAGAWIGKQQLGYIHSRGLNASFMPLDGIEDIRRSLLRTF